MVVRGKTLTKRELDGRSHFACLARGKEYVVQYGVRVLRVQSPQRQPSAGRGRLRMLWEPKTPRTSYLVIEMGSGPATWKRYIEIGNDR